MKIGALKMTHDLNPVVSAYAGYDSSAAWNQIYRAGLRMTKEQVAAFVEEYQTLLAKYLTEPGDHPPDSRPMAVRLVVVPDEGPRPPPADSADRAGRRSAPREVTAPPLPHQARPLPVELPPRHQIPHPDGIVPRPQRLLPVQLMCREHPLHVDLNP